MQNFMQKRRARFWYVTYKMHLFDLQNAFSNAEYRDISKL